MKTNYLRISPKDRTDYRELISPVSEAVWPEYMHHDTIANEHWDSLYEYFPNYQFALLDSENGTVAGIANSVPLAWDGLVEDLPDEGWDWALIQSGRDHTEGRKPRTLCGIQISISPSYQGKGLSSLLLKEMRELALAKAVKRLIVPVRPSLKHRYPLTPSEAYIAWTNEKGLPFDPWLRVHVRNGGKIIKVCHQAMRIPGTIQEWEAWTGMRFPESGKYVVAGALTPIAIDTQLDLGAYIEPNVWVLHEL